MDYDNYEMDSASTHKWQYIGNMPSRSGKPFELYNNLVPINDVYDSPGFTLTRETLVSLGVTIPDNLKVGDSF